MTTAIAMKLLANVTSSIDLDALFPNSALKGLIALDVEILKGAISPGKMVWLSSAIGSEALVIMGIEMNSNSLDPNKVRIHCSKPKRIELPLAATESWTIAEE